LRALLAEVPRIKAFGETQGLKPTANYEAYADLQRPAAVWVVSACQPLAFTSKTWSFPIVGQVPYLGFFDEGEGHDYARELRAQGLDVDERGSGAFSTLGWFHDPILSTMVSPGEGALGDLAEVVLHESVHATVFLPGEVDLNERLADFIASKLTPLYLQETRGPDSEEARAWEASEAWARARRARMHEAYLALAELYASGASTPEKVERKGTLLEALRRELRTSRSINNATLAQFRTYHRPLPELDALFEACGRSVTRLLGAVQRLRSGSPVPPELERMSREGCPVSRARTAR
jgi:predicted aminopeptidase